MTKPPLTLDDLLNSPATKELGKLCVAKMRASALAEAEMIHAWAVEAQSVVRRPGSGELDEQLGTFGRGGPGAVHLSEEFSSHVTLGLDLPWFAGALVDDSPVEFIAWVELLRQDVDSVPLAGAEDVGEQLVGVEPLMPLAWSRQEPSSLTRS